MDEKRCYCGKHTESDIGKKFPFDYQIRYTGGGVAYYALLCDKCGQPFNIPTSLVTQGITLAGWGGVVGGKLHGQVVHRYILPRAAGCPRCMISTPMIFSICHNPDLADAFLALIRRAADGKGNNQ